MTYLNIHPLGNNENPVVTGEAWYGVINPTGIPGPQSYGVSIPVTIESVDGNIAMVSNGFNSVCARMNCLV